MIVVDTNVIVFATLHGADDRMGAHAAGALRRDPVWAAPPLWRSEFCNVMATQIRHAGLSDALALAALADAIALVGPRERRVDPAEVLAAAVASRCTAYDCEFVVLAHALGVPVVTTDRAILRSFPRAAVSLAEFAGG